MRSKVDLPTPFGPTRPMRLRCGILNESSEKISKAPKDFERLVTESKGMFMLPEKC
jgi:hypothetical protein